MLSKDELLALTKAEPVEVEVAGFPEPVTLAPMSVSDFTEFAQASSTGGVDFAIVLARSWVSEDGERLFTDEQVKAMRHPGLPALALKAAEVNGLTDEAQQGLVGN